MWWSCLLNALPTRSRLARFLQITDVSCPLCSSADESTEHLFFYCPFAAHLWLSSQWSLNTQASLGKSVFDWCVEFWEVENRIMEKDIIICYAACLMDNIWQVRNEVTHGATTPSFPTISARFLKLFSLAWSSHNPALAIHSSVWLPPPDGWMKINFDAAASSSSAKVGAVARDHEGSILCSRTLLLPPFSPLFAEAKACLLAVLLAKDHGWRFCIFEGNAKMVIDACCSSNSCPWEIRPIVRDILDLAYLFIAWDFCFVHR
ncbi:hypothetical protein UlMin_030722 [Ulmus minor]